MLLIQLLIIKKKIEKNLILIKKKYLKLIKNILINVIIIMI